MPGFAFPPPRGLDRGSLGPQFPTLPVQSPCGSWTCGTVRCYDSLRPLVRQAAIDYGPDIRINVLCPGPVDTPLIWDSAAAFPDPARAVSDVAARTLLKRLGTPDDIAHAALFLASGESGFVTGTSLTIDGGIMTGA